MTITGWMHPREETCGESFYAKDLEPTLEPCMKVQRSTGVNGKRSRMSQEAALIRVVPPSLRSLTVGMEALFIYLPSSGFANGAAERPPFMPKKKRRNENG